MSVWRDEAHGKPDADVQLSEEEQAAAEQDQEMTDHVPEQATTAPPTDIAHSSPPSSRAASYPPTSDMESEPSHVVDGVSDTDMDAMIQEYANEPQDEDMWQDPDALEEYFAASAPPQNPDTSNAETVNSGMSLTDYTSTTPLPEEEEDWGEDMYI